MTEDSSVDKIIAALGLKPHPEGGYYVETWRDESGAIGRNAGGRGAGTAIYYLLKAGEISAWHRIDATEIWHWYAGDPLVLSIFEEGQGRRTITQRAIILGGNVAAGQTPQAIVPPYAWQMAESRGAWTLVGCTVSPAFDFARFELAPPGWTPQLGNFT